MIRDTSYVAAIVETVNSMADFWPVTLRTIYYRLVAALLIQNTLYTYKKLSRDLTTLRREHVVPWDAIEDIGRPYVAEDVDPSPDAYLSSLLPDLFTGYTRDLWQTQEERVEVWIEKAALMKMVLPVTQELQVPLAVAKGFASASYRREFAERVKRRAYRPAEGVKGQPTTILYFGDLDPSGYEMLPSMMRKLTKEHPYIVRAYRSEHCGLTPEHVHRYNLPRSIDALKEKDKRTPKFRAKYGDLAVELDALAPGDLQNEIRAAIVRNMDMAKFEAERAKATEDDTYLAEKRQKVLEILGVAA